MTELFAFRRKRGIRSHRRRGRWRKAPEGFPHRTFNLPPHVRQRTAPKAPLCKGGWPCVSKVWGIVPQRLELVCGCRLCTAEFSDMEQSGCTLINRTALHQSLRQLSLTPPFTQGRLWCSATLLMQ